MDTYRDRLVGVNHMFVGQFCFYIASDMIPIVFSNVQVHTELMACTDPGEDL